MSVKFRKITSLILIIIMAIVPILVGLVFYSAENIAPYAIIKPARILHHYPEDYAKTKFGIEGSELWVLAGDSTEIYSLFARSTKPGLKPCVILLHGIADSHESRYGDARRLLDSGFDVLLTDLRAHGRSGGKYCTFGYYEAEDITTVMDSLTSKYGERDFGIWGHSLGAAVALRTMARDKRIKFGIIQSTFASLHDITYDYMKLLLGVRWKWYLDKALRKAEILANFDADSVNPAKDARNITAPVLYIHGTDDERISIANGRKIFKNLASADKKFIEIKGAHHNDVAKIGGEDYYAKVFEFLDRVGK